MEDFRRQKKWNDIYKHFPNTTLDANVKKFFEKLLSNNLNKIIIVTSSPYKYANQLLSYHNFMTSVPIIAYHDTKEHKPSAEPYKMALLMLKHTSDEIYIFGDQQSDFEAADNLKTFTNIPIFKIGCNWYYNNHLQNTNYEMNIDNMNDFLKIL